MDSVCFFNGSGVPRISPAAIPLSGSALDSRPLPTHVSSLGRRTAAAAVSVDTPADPGTTSNYFARPFRFLWSAAAEKPIDELALGEAFVTEEEDGEEELYPEGEGSEHKYENLYPGKRRGNWVLKILHIRSIWSEKKARQDRNGVTGDKEVDDSEELATDQSCCQCCGDDQDGVCGVGDGGELTDFDRATFSRFLKRVSLVEARLYAQMSYLGNLAYAISKIKPGNLLKYHGLRFVTSSLEKKEIKGVNTEDKMKSKSSKTEKKQSSPENEEIVKETDDKLEVEKQKRFGIQISASAAYQIAAAAASYVQSQTKNMLPFSPAKTEVKNVNEGVHANDSECSRTSDITGSDMASFVATTSSVTAVVAAEEEMKQAVAKDLNSVHSSPCEWFICDVENTETRLFVIQGSETLASWQANLLFEPIQFEGLDVLVHRGIYEAAKGIYKQMLPEVRAHLKLHGESARLRFTGHSLGGSLALLVNLMLLVRGEVPRSSLLPVITFGSPSIMCGGDYLLRKLDLPRSHVQAITMHRDIVPRAFSCNYPDHVAELLKAVNGNFRNHPCLKYQKSLYTPMGELLILQPDEKFSPQHHLLPPGSGFYRLSGSPDSKSADILAGKLRAAETAFLNSPHPLEILSDRSAYGSDGTIYRDHDMNSYLRSVRFVVRQELNRLMKAKREQRRKLWWPLVSPKREAAHLGVIVAPRPFSAVSSGQKHQLIFSGILRTGKESLRRISRLVASQYPHVLLLLVPVRLLLLSAFPVISSR